MTIFKSLSKQIPTSQQKDIVNTNKFFDQKQWKLFFLQLECETTKKQIERLKYAYKALISNTRWANQPYCINNSCLTNSCTA